MSNVETVQSRCGPTNIPHKKYAGGVVVSHVGVLLEQCDSILYSFLLWHYIFLISDKIGHPNCVAITIVLSALPSQATFPTIVLTFVKNYGRCCPKCCSIERAPYFYVWSFRTDQNSAHSDSPLAHAESCRWRSVPPKRPRPVASIGVAGVIGPEVVSLEKRLYYIFPRFESAVFMLFRVCVGRFRCGGTSRHSWAAEDPIPTV